MPAPELDNDPEHTKLLKATVAFFARQVANLFRTGRCADCPSCSQSAANLGVYFTKCLMRELDIPLVLTVQLQVEGRVPPDSTPPASGGVN
jgi:hypothetical protein